MTDPRELVHDLLLATLFVLLEALPGAIAQPLDCQPPLAGFTPASICDGKLARAIVTIAAGELDKTSQPINPIPMPEDGAEVRSAAFEGGELLLRAGTAGFGRRHLANGLAKSGLGLRSQRQCRLFLFDAEVEDDRRSEAKCGHLTALSVLPERR